jgi:hypothetical protein
MIKAKAEQECSRLQSTDPDRETHTFRPHQRDDGEWEVAKLSIPPHPEPGKGLVEAKPKPPTPSDPSSDAAGYIPRHGGY